jgi:hypothetical protein
MSLSILSSTTAAAAVCLPTSHEKRLSICIYTYRRVPEKSISCMSQTVIFMKISVADMLRVVLVEKKIEMNSS